MKILLPLFLCIGTILYGQSEDFAHISYKKADSIAFALKGASLKNLPALTHKLTSNLETDVAKFRAIYTWVCTNIKNDYHGYLKTKKKRKKLAEDTTALTRWNNSYTPTVFKKLIEDQKTACTGYAYLIREFSRLAHIDCEIVDGFGRTANTPLTTKSLPNHSWNAVRLNGNWYLCDATWSAGRIMINDDLAEFKSDYFDGYFLAEPRVFIKNHYPVQSRWALLNTPPTFKEFSEGPIIYKEAFKPIVIPVFPKKMRLEITKNDSVTFKITLPDTIPNEDIKLIVNSGSNNITKTPKITRSKNEATIRHNFTKNGKYDVHIKIREAIITTYVVKVSRK